jgi:hypothetical protein
MANSTVSVVNRCWPSMIWAPHRVGASRRPAFACQQQHRLDKK